MVKTRISLLLVIFCSVFSYAQDREMILQNFEQQQECWNKGDIECYCEAYLPSDSVRVISSQGVLYGYDNILELYQKYWTPENMGELSFSGL